MSTGSDEIQCPICGKSFSRTVITEHADSCLTKNEYDQPKLKSSGKRKSSAWSFLTKSNQPCLNGEFAKSASKRSKSNIEKINDQRGRSSYKEDFVFIDDDQKGRSSYKEDFVFIDDDQKPDDLKCAVGQRFNEDHTSTHQGSSLSSRTKKLPILSGPLADKIRPRGFDTFIGQTKAVGRNSTLHSILTRTSNIPSMILWGPPGCGKTTLAKIISNKCQQTGGVKFTALSATSASVSDVKELAKVAQNDQKLLKRKTILFLDEIHRFNKLQQDTLLPHVENGLITLIGATTENPSFHVNNALLSRCRVVSLEKLQMKDLQLILRQACRKIGVTILSTKGDSPLPGMNNEEEGNTQEAEMSCEQEFCLTSTNTNDPVCVSIEDAAIEALSGMVDGDARAAVNALQVTLQASLVGDTQGKEVKVTVDNVKDSLQQSHLLYDRNGEEHFNIASAFIKSMRGSDDSAALYWMTRMLEGGENPLFVARRLVVFASEDVGLADPTALKLAVSTFQACQLIGMPECGVNLAHCTVYLSRAAKSVEAYCGYQAAQQCVRSHQGPFPSVPLHLRNASTKLMKSMGCGQGYKYPPAFEGKVQQEYFPSSLSGTDFFSFMKNKRPRDTDAQESSSVE